MSFRVNPLSIVSLKVKELLARSRSHIWDLSDSNEIRTHNHLVRKRTLNHLAKLARRFSCVVSTHFYGAFDCTNFRVNPHSISSNLPFNEGCLINPERVSSKMNLVTMAANNSTKLSQTGQIWPNWSNGFTSCVKSVQILSFIWFVFSYVRTEYGDLLGFSRSGEPSQ